MKKADLIAVLKEEWKRLDMSQVEKLIQSMLKRLEAVITAKGGSTGH